MKLTERVPEHASCNRSNELGGLSVAVHGIPARLEVEVELETTSESNSTTDDQKHQGVEHGSDESSDEDL